MFSKLFGSAEQKLERQVAQKLEAARDAQRAGDMPLYARLTEEAETLQAQLEAERGGGR